MQHRLLDIPNLIRALEEVRVMGWAREYEAKKHQVRIETPTGAAFLRLPLHVKVDTTTWSIQEELINTVVILLEAGQAATGYFEDDENLHHKVFRAYMVRKKQGKSQIKYLKTKGKSRAGSRVRLAETESFFVEINQQLQHYFSTYRIDRIAVSLSKTLLPFFFQSETPPPFQKDDPRIYTIPRHVAESNYAQLLASHRFLRMGELKTQSDNSPFTFLEAADNSESEMDGESDDW